MARASKMLGILHGIPAFLFLVAAVTLLENLEKCAAGNNVIIHAPEKRGRSRPAAPAKGYDPESESSEEDYAADYNDKKGSGRMKARKYNRNNLDGGQSASYEDYTDYDRKGSAKKQEPRGGKAKGGGGNRNQNKKERTPPKKSRQKKKGGRTELSSDDNYPDYGKKKRPAAAAGKKSGGGKGGKGANNPNNQNFHRINQDTDVSMEVMDESYRKGIMRKQVSRSEAMNKVN